MFTIEELIIKHEDQFFDRKSPRIAPAKLAEAIVAFANADGGSIAIGINDGKLEGINSQGNVKIQDFIQCGFDCCVPSIRIEHYFIDGVKENGNIDRVLVIDVKPSINQVHSTTSDKVYLRIGDESKLLNHDQRIKLEYDKGTRIYEDSIIEGFEFEDLNLDIIEEYKKAINFKEDDIEKLLRARGFIKRVDGVYKYTVAAVLMFCDYPAAFIPGAKLRFIRYEGKVAETGTRMNIIKQETFDSAIPILIENVKSMVKSQLREFTALKTDTGKFHTIPEYPVFAWQEGIVNAITHRAYNIHGDDIKVIMYDDRLEISSPGNLPDIVNIENIREVRYSRNPKIARALTELGWVRELGEGVKRIYEEMKNYFLDDPVFEEKDNKVILTLKNNIVMRSIRRQERINSNISGQWSELDDYSKVALEITYSKGQIKTKELSEKLGITRAPARRILDSLVEKGLLRKVSTSKNDPNQYYEMIIE